ncbi:pilus assembly protein TadG-related protein [Aquibacillus salsiterrae]|uniref:Pilus assembly protein TadG-related protein n=1 Tax=Aquibacillus salsiterrae TaxID=2950439 RepID=A0A9X3WDX6_9BACI|nr:pilus assembly protein TadG-related protein [Aquibacillus salsiterrae]MDC3416943.1 pilus assembly protein TadG-related protein [Aquibacillus salsiterrae]
MYQKIKELLKKENGNVLVLVSISFMSLLTMAGFIIDGGKLYMTKAHLQKVANAAALSGAQELTSGDKTLIDSIVYDILDYQNERQSLTNDYQVVADDQVVLNNRVEVGLTKPVPLEFSRVFGLDAVDVSARAVARLGVMGRARGAAPLGIDQSVPLEYGVSYQLKVDSSDVNTGNFGVLALEDPGARTYEENLRSGFQNELQVGDVVDTQTGNIAGKTRSVIDELVDSCSDVNARDCDRILLVPVYKPYNQDVNQLMQVEITGFAYFYILERMSATDTAITGMFIKRTGTGYEDAAGVDRGAYSVRLTE